MEYLAADPTPEDIRTAQQAAEQALADAATRFGLDENLRVGCSSDSMQLFLMGDPTADASILYGGAVNTVGSLGFIERRFDAISKNDFAPGLALIEGRRTARRRATRDLEANWVVGDEWDDPGMLRWQNEVAGERTAGLRRSHTIAGLTLALRLHYDTVLRPTPERTTPLRLAARALGKAVAWLRREPSNPPDLTRETLDARVQSFLAMVQLNTIGLFLNDLFELGSVGRPGRERATMLFNHHRTSLFQDALDSKRQMMLDLGEHFSGLRSNFRDHQAGLMLEALSERSHSVAVDMDRTRQFLAEIYDALGYDAPDTLRPAPEPETEVVASVVGGLAVDIDSSTVASEETAAAEPIDPEILATFSARLAQLQNNIATFSRPWRPTAAARRPYRTLTQRLQLGFTGSAKQVFEPISYPQQTVDVLVRLHHLASRSENIKVATQTLTHALAAQQQLESETRALRQWADEHNIPYHSDDYPAIPSLQQSVRHIRLDWDRYREVMDQAWPDGTGAQAAQLVRQLLDAWSNT